MHQGWVSVGSPGPCYASLMGLLGRLFGRSKQHENIEESEMPAPSEPLLSNVALQTPAPFPATEPTATESAVSNWSEDVETVTLPSCDFSVLDLRELQTVRARIVGSGFWVTTHERTVYGGMDYLLVREPENKHDENAVAIYGKGRKVGYVTTSKAAAMSSLLEAMGYDRYLIGGAGVDPNSSKLWADLPSIPALRKFAKNHVAGFNAIP